LNFARTLLPSTIRLPRRERREEYGSAGRLTNIKTATQAADTKKPLSKKRLLC
jgi:hypothetical protein